MSEASGMSPTVEPHHDRQGFCLLRRSPNVQVEAVLAAFELAATPDEGVFAKRLIAGVGEGLSASGAGP